VYPRRHSQRRHGGRPGVGQSRKPIAPALLGGVCGWQSVQRPGRLPEEGQMREVGQRRGCQGLQSWGEGGPAEGSRRRLPVRGCPSVQRYRCPRRSCWEGPPRARERGPAGRARRMVRPKRPVGATRQRGRGRCGCPWRCFAGRLPLGQRRPGQQSTISGERAGHRGGWGPGWSWPQCHCCANNEDAERRGPSLREESLADRPGGPPPWAPGARAA
jgi:hypothetical protein